MNVEIDPKQERRLEALARSEGKPMGELVHELLDEALLSRERDGSGAESDEAVARSQRGAWERVFQDFDALPNIVHGDGLSGSADHDQIIYGGRP
jgi:hypothetical protein